MSKILVVGSLIVDVSAHTPHFPVVGEKMCIRDRLRTSRIIWRLKMIKILKYKEVENKEIFARADIKANVEDIVFEIIENEMCIRDRYLC